MTPALLHATWNGPESVYGPPVGLDEIPPAFRVALWCGLRSDVMPPGKTTAAQVHAWAALARYGGPAPAWCAPAWFPAGTVPADTFAVADCEGRTLAESASIAAWMKRYKPQGWTVWGIEPNLDLTRLADVEPPTVAAIAARIDAIDPVLRAAPVLTVCCYVLGPGSIQRDIKARVLMAAALRKRYPGKPVLALLWGAYHTAWNPANSRLPNGELDQLVGMVRAWFDGSVTWGERQPNLALMKKLAG